ncbi:MAG: AAA family ATPase, partial [Candidatus Heimdallarchaeaceae archaeon]
IIPSGVDISKYIPERDENGYILRTDFEAKLRLCFEKKEPVLLIGETGTGKTKSIFEFCARHKIPLYNVSCAFDLNLRELFGFRHLKENKTVWQEGRLIPFIHADRDVVICFDEINRLPADRLTILFKMLENRMVEVFGADRTYVINPNVWIVFTGNPAGKLYDAFSIDPAIVSRMSVIEVEFFSDNLIKKFYSKKVNDKDFLDRLIGFLKEVRKFTIESGYKVQYNLRSLNKFLEFYDSSGSLAYSLSLAFFDQAYALGGDKQRKNIIDIANAYFDLVGDIEKHEREE